MTLAGSGLGGWSLDFWYLPWVTESSLVCEAEEGGDRAMDLGSVVLCRRDMLQGRRVIYYLWELALQGQSLPSQLGPLRC